MPGSVQLGPFELADRIGEGGMGAIYRGTHRKTGVPVAIKVIRRRADEGACRQFQEEVQAHAGLQHPGVVYLFEYGRIDAAAADASGGELRRGDPFVAMELADRGTVRDAMPLSRWATVCRMLVEILDALAYSHARGVVHRDLKPENFLVFETDGAADADWRVKLADFGIAHAFRGEREAETEILESAAGTPLYIAPEQFRGQWRRYGPWTDLYALGCITWELVCGHPPFLQDSLVELMMSHDSKPRPPLEPQFPVPDGLESWIHRAMAPDPDRRFRRAADAAWALPRGALADRPDSVESAGDPERDDRRADGGATGEPAAVEQTKQLRSTVLLTGYRQTAAPDGEQAVEEMESDGPGAAETGAADEIADDEPDSGPDAPSPADATDLFADSHPPIPVDWRPEQSESLPAPLVGAGLGLFGLREPPFVNRTDECDRIWEALRRGVEDQRLETVFIAGDAGTGKSRLAEWMATRAHEVGAVRVVRAVHTSGGGPNEGLPGALERTLRCVRMERAEVFDHLRETLTPLEDRGGDWLERDARALTEYLRPTDDEADDVDGPRYRFSSPDQKHALVTRVLERLARRRPVLLWLDDLQWGPEALGLLEHLEDASRQVPELLVLATVRTDVVGERPELRDRLEVLSDGAASTFLPLEPLAGDHQRELLGDLLPLEDDLADRLTARTEGHPSFAMQLLGHWIEQDALRVGSGGFRVADARQPELPEDIHALWQTRLERLVGDLSLASPTSARAAIERAAVLGRQVDAAEWRGVCEDLDLEHPDRLRDSLVERGLAERSDFGWAFGHGLIVASLERRARAAGRLQTHHRRCAELLEGLYPDRPEQTAARRVNHRIEAGDFKRALPPLMEKAEAHWESGDPKRTRHTLERRRALLDRLDIPDDDPRSIENVIRRARCDLTLDTSPDTVLASLEEARRRAERLGDDRLQARAWRETSVCRRRMGDWETAREAARTATRLAETSGEADERIDALREWGFVEFFAGNLDEAERRFTDARARARQAGNRYRELVVEAHLAFVAMGRGDAERAATLFKDALQASRDAGFHTNAMGCLNGLGEIARFRGDADTARDRYRRYGQLARQLHLLGSVGTARKNLAQVELMAGRFDEAERQLREAERAYERCSRKSENIHGLKLVGLTLAAGRGSGAEFDAMLQEYVDGWPDDAPLEKDHPWLLEMAGDYAAEAGQRRRAEGAWRLAGDLWDRLGDAKAGERVSRKIEG